MTSEPPFACWSLDEPADRVERALAVLSADERRRAEAFTGEASRRRFVLARAGLRERLAKRLGVTPAGLAFEYGPAGKPRLAGGGSIEFNLAHSGELAVCVIADGPVGVDLEAVRPRKSAPALAARWFHPAECERIAAAADTLAEFYRTWVMKEAALKLVGLGVGESLPKVLTPGEPHGGQATGLPANELGLAACHVAPLTVAPGYAAAVATPLR